MKVLKTCNQLREKQLHKQNKMQLLRLLPFLVFFGFLSFFLPRRLRRTFDFRAVFVGFALETSGTDASIAISKKVTI